MEDSRTDIIPGESIPAVLVANLDPANAPPADRLRAQKRNMGKTVYIVEARGGEGKNEYGHAPGAIAAANTAIAAGYNACVLYYAWKDHEAVRATLLQKSVTGIVLLTGSLLPGFSQRRLDEIVAEAEVAGKSVGTNLAEVGVPVQPHTIVVCGPSGAGKGTLIARLLARFPTRFGFSVSHTTRAPRPGEVDGVHYHFVTQQAFDELVAHGEFVEHAQVHGNSYGTTRAAIEAVLAQGKACVLDIDVQGARNVKAAGVDATFVFIAPPSLEQLEARLRKRGTETEPKIQLRLAGARAEMEASQQAGFFHHVVVNGDPEKAYSDFEALLTPLAGAGAPAADGGGSPAAAGAAVEPPPAAADGEEAAAGAPAAADVLRIVISGPPAGGKGTQCERIKEKYGCYHISTGDVLRAAAADEQNQIGQAAKAKMEAGELVPDDLICELLRQELERPQARERGWLLDGFPRTGGQVAAMGAMGIRPNKVVMLRVPDEVLLKRVLGRRMDPQTGTIYHVEFNPVPSDAPDKEAIEARLITREDDTEAKFSKRIAAFHANEQELLKAYPDALILDGNRHPDQIWADIDKYLADAEAYTC